MAAVVGIDARERVLQRQSSSQLQYIALGQLRERREHLEHVVHPALDEPREPGEERVGGVGERVALQRAQRDLVHPVQLAPDAGQGQEQQVPAGKVDGVVGRVVVRYVVPGHAPVRSVDGRDRDVHDDEGLGRRIGERAEEPPEMDLLGAFPRQPESHVDGVNGTSPTQQVSDEDGTVGAPAGEHRDRVAGRRLAHPSPR